METSGMWSKQNVADFLFQEMIQDPKKRKTKLNNWITRKILPGYLKDKIGGETIFFKEKIIEWWQTRKAA